MYSGGGGGSVGFRNKILYSYCSVYILYTFFEQHVCNIDQIIICAHVSLIILKTKSHMAQMCIYGENIPLECYILYYYCHIDEDRNIVYSRTHVQIVEKQDTIYYYIMCYTYRVLTTIYRTYRYEQKHCRFTNTKFQSAANNNNNNNNISVCGSVRFYTLNLRLWKICVFNIKIIIIKTKTYR